MMRSWTCVAIGLVIATAGLVPGGCLLNPLDECLEDDSCGGPRAGAGPGGSAAGGGTGGATGGGGAGGVGGQEPCGGACEDPTPLCDENTDTCVACLGGGDCTSGAFPVCHEGACVACTPAEDALCTAVTPYCDPLTFTCAPCRYHGHCPDSACNPFTGACLDAVPETVGPSGDYADLTTALASVAAGGEAVFRVSPNTGNSSYEEQLQLGGGSIVALLGENGRPRLTNNNTFPTLTVATGSTLLLAGLDLRLNGSAVGLQTAGLVALDQVEVASNNGGGINATDTAELLIRNSIVAANGDNQTEDAMTLTGATATVIYSSIAGLTVDPSAAINCSSSYTLTVRNSILLKRWGSGEALAGCGSATVASSYNDSIDNATGLSWFDGWASDLHLLAAGVTTFTDVAVWQSGDPPTDIDGNPRPSTDGTPDVAGADEGP